MYELCPYLFSVRILSKQLYCVLFHLSPHMVKGIQVTASVFAVCHVCSTIELFFFPSQGMLGWEGFYLSQLFCACFFVFMYGERKRVTASMFQSAKYVPLNSFFCFPRMLHWQQFDLSNSFVFVCLFVCLRTLWKGSSHSLSVVCCQACTISLTKCCFLFAIYVSSLA